MAPSPLSEDGHEWMRRFQDGDESAFREIFLAFKEPLHRFIFRYFNDADMAAELTQEVFLRVYQAKSTYRPGSRFSSWVFQIAANLCLNTLRNRRRETPLDPLLNPENVSHEEPVEKISQGPESCFQQTVHGQAIARAIQSLPESQRALVLLVYYEDFSITDAAQALDITVLGARLRLMRARKALRKVLKIDL